jgi:hypothetical protein
MEFGPIDVDAVRRRTPARLRRVFLLSAASSLPSTTTLDAVMDHLRLEAEIGMLRRQALTGTRIATRFRQRPSPAMNPPSRVVIRDPSTASCSQCRQRSSNFDSGPSMPDLPQLVTGSLALVI